MRVEVSTVVERPVADVWDFYAVNHVTNHPRWDETVELKATENGTIGVGTVIQRRVTRFGHVTEGIMEVTAFVPEQMIRVRTQDGPMTIDGFASFREIGDGMTEITIGAEIPDIDQSMAEQLRIMAGGSVARIRALIESET